MSEEEIKREIKKMSALDDAAEKAGGYVSPSLKDNVHYDYRKILAYCSERGIEPQDMTIRELDRFIIPA